MGRHLLQRSMGRVLCGLLTVVAMLAAKEGYGQTTPSTAAPAQIDWSLGVDTELPLSVGLYTAVKLNRSFRASLGVGVFPGPYLDLIHAAVIPFTQDSGYTSDDAVVVRSALENSLVIRANAGWQLTESLYTELGYGYVGLGGGTSSRDLLVLITQYPLPAGAGQNGSGDDAFDIESQLHMLRAEFGWEWQSWPPWVVRAALGVAWTVASETQITPTKTPRFGQVSEALTDYGERYLDALYTQYVISPTLRVGVAYSF